jgi:hypothetical protein
MFSSPAIKGVIMGVGNVGESLVKYTDSDTFISRNGGYDWEEVHKGAHMWKFGDSGSIIIIVNDEEPVNYVKFTTDEGLNWRTYEFGKEKMRVESITTVMMETSRKFVLFGVNAMTKKWSAVYLDFSILTPRKCTCSFIFFKSQSGLCLIVSQAKLTTITQATMISSSGVPAKPDLRAACSDDRYALYSDLPQPLSMAHPPHPSHLDPVPPPCPHRQLRHRPTG